MRRRTLAVLAITVVVAAACGGLGAGGSIEGSWELDEGTYDGQPIPTVPSHPITITFEDDQVFGTAACNGFGGSYTLRGSRISFTEFGVTEMACFPEVAMASEQAFLEALFNVESAEVVDGELVLTGSRTTMTFAPIAQVSAADLLGTVWVLDSLIQGESVSSVAGDRATLELFSDGSLIGSTGCRTLTGSYEVSGPQVVFTDFAASGQCPPELQTQDSQVITALEGGFNVDIDGDTLTVSISGDEGLIFKADR